LIDLGPTISELVGWDKFPDFQGVPLSNFLPGNRGFDKKSRPIWFSVDTAIAQGDGVLINGRWKLIHDRLTNRRYLFDLFKDEREQHNLSAKCPAVADNLFSFLSKIRQAHELYYNNFYVHSTFFPPSLNNDIDVNPEMVKCLEMNSQNGL
jgi:arylsulfatase A-like enzyme